MKEFPWSFDGKASPPCGGDSKMTMGGIFLRLDWEPLREHGLTTGVVRHACRLRRDGTRRFLFGGFFCGWTGSRCGSMA